jgi:ABC-2 type transport system permease protein
MILAVAWNRLLNLKHDRAAFVLAFVVPVAFFSVFAAIFGGGGRSATRRVPVVVVDEDASESSRRFVAALAAEKGLAVQTTRTVSGQPAPLPYERASSEAAVRAGTVSVALIVPRGFGSAPMTLGPGSGNHPRLLVLADSADPVAPQLLTGLIQKVAMTSMPEAMVDAGIQAMDRRGGGLTPEQRKRLEENARMLRSPTTATAAGAQPSAAAGLIDVDVRDVLGQTKKNPTSAVLAAGLGVMFLLFSAAGAGGALIEEAEGGTLDRILSTRVSMTPLLLGKLLYLSSVAVAQLTVMFVWGEFFFGVELHRHAAGFLIMSIATGLACSTFGLVLAAISRSRMQLVALSNLIILVMSALGGSMVPRYFLSEKIQKIGLLTINAWAIDGFLKVFWREEPLAHLWPQVTVLLSAAILLFLIARRLARRWELV